MCGIAGVLALDWARDRAERALTRMGDAIAHRGPDGSGLHWDAGVGIAMRRLAIVDIAGGQQPMASDDGQVWLVYNGEIFNAPAIRRHLIARGHRFRSRSDTEVILRLYLDRGLDFAESMRGMWALAIHDKRQRRVILSRDRLGIKPLHVLELGRSTLFASELRAFRSVETDLAAGALDLDPCAAQAMLAWSYIPGTRSIYKNVRSIAPGTHEVFDSGVLTARQRYWQLQESSEAKDIRSMGDAVDLVDAELRRAVSEHLEADVPVGAFVSGGIDSGLIAAYAADAAPNLSTFTIGFDVATFDESAYAAIVAKTLGTEHTLRRIGAADVYGALVDVLVRLDGPFGDSSLIAAWTVAKIASETHKVVLSGDGGDEVFAGYVKHGIVHWRRQLGGLPPSAFIAARALLQGLPQSRERRGTDFVRKALRALTALGVPADVAYASLTRVATLAEAADLMTFRPRHSPFPNLVESIFSSAPGDDEISKTLAADLSLVLPNDMLSKVDQASMLNSLEARVPFVDHRLVEMGWSLPKRFTLGAAKGKLVLRELFARRFPKHLAARPKQGFQVPVESWLAGPLQPALERVFAPDRLERGGVLDPRAFGPEQRKRLLACRPLLLWNAFCFAAWSEMSTGALSEGELRSFLGGPSRAPRMRPVRGSSSECDAPSVPDRAHS